MAAAIMALRKRAKKRREERERRRRERESSMSLPESDASSSKAAVQADASAPPPAPPVIHFQGQQQLYDLYMNTWVQLAVACVIVGNFCVTIAEKEIDPYFELYGSTWKAFDTTFNILFTIELILNMAGSWFCHFWKNPWNVFDFIVVLVSLLAMGNALQGPLEDLKMLRAFRVFRLFKRVKSLNKIVTSLVRAIPGVFNAFLIMLIVMCIYAIIAVDYFKTFGSTGGYVTQSSEMNEFGVTIILNHTVDAFTQRKIRYGEEYYGTFSRALYTLFQVLTGESWAEAVARPLIFGKPEEGYPDSPWSVFGVSTFFVSFILLMQIVLVNVVVAVLLDKFVDDEGKPPQLAAAAAADANSPSHALPAGAGTGAVIGTTGLPPPKGFRRRDSNSSSERLEIEADIAKIREDVTELKQQLGQVSELTGRIDLLIKSLSTTGRIDLEV
jgi:hypothetical protein